MLALAALLAPSMPTAAQSVTAVCLRTSQVQAAIVAASPASACGGVTEAHLAALTELDVSEAEITLLNSGDFSGLTALEDLQLQGNQLSGLPAGVFSGLTSLTELQLQANQLSSLRADVFSGLTALTTLRLWNNQLTSLPAGVFSGLTLLTTLELDGNPVDPLPVAVSLASAGEGQFTAVMPTGAPFAVTLPVSVMNGVIDGGATTLTIPVGAVESGALSVTRNAGTFVPVTGDIGTLPGRPAGHLGYVLQKATGLPVEILPAVVSEVSITADAAMVTEGEAAAFTVKRTGGDVSKGLTVSVEVSEDGAMLDGTPPTAVTFVAESATAALSVATASDTAEEANSVVTARVTASSDGEYTLSEVSSATVTVEDDDKLSEPTLSIAVAPDAIAEAGTESATVTVSASPAFAADQTISLTLSGTATVTADYTISVDGATLSSPYELTLSAGDASTEATVTAVDDMVVEGAETIGITAALDGDQIGDQQTVTITDDDSTPTNNAPAFAADTGTREVAENAAPGADVGAPVTAMDDDGDTLTYALTGTDAGAFAIDGDGQITVGTNTVLDYEMKSSYSVTVTATDPSNAAASIEVTVGVTNVDEPGAVTLSSDQPQVDTALTAVLTDPDGGVTGLSWQWARSADGSSGWTNVAGATSAGYTPTAAGAGSYLRTTAIYADAEGGGKTAIGASVEATIAGAGGVPPSDNADLGALSVNGSSVNGFNNATLSYMLYVANDVAEATVSAIPADPAATVTYSSAQPVTLAEGDNTVTIVVTAGVATKTYTVTITRSAAAAPPPPITGGGGGSVNWVPQFTEGATTTRFVAENAEPGENIGAPVAATDLDQEDTLAYVLEGADAEFFDVHPATGQLLTKAPLDYETRESYTLTVEVSDDWRNSGAIEVTIMVTDVDEGPPSSRSAAIAYAENGAGPVAVYVAMAAEGSTVVWSLSGEDAAVFAIDGGTLSFRTQPDYEAPVDADGDNAYLVTVQAAEDSGASGWLRVVVAVTDVELTSVCARYDADRNEAIDRDEAVRAVVKYFSGDIDKEEVLEVIQLYLAA